MTYPSGRRVHYGLDASDRVNVVQNLTGGGNYATIAYTAPGGMNALTMGNGVTQQVSWNDRLQPTALSVKTASQTSLLALSFFPCPGGSTSCSSGNNGNLLGQTITLPGPVSLTQSYTYDGLNRLQSATENSGTLQNYSYAGNGNRFVTSQSASPSPITL